MLTFLLSAVLLCAVESSPVVLKFTESFINVLPEIAE